MHRVGLRIRMVHGSQPADHDADRLQATGNWMMKRKPEERQQWREGEYGAGSGLGTASSFRATEARARVWSSRWVVKGSLFRDGAMTKTGSRHDCRLRVDMMGASFAGVGDAELKSVAGACIQRLQS